MRLHDKPRTDVASGFSLIELAVTSAVIIVVVLLLFSCQAQDRRLALKAACRANLSRIGLAFRVMRVEFNDRYPMQVSKRLGGTQEYADTAEVFRHFQVLSNDLQTPKVLVCPADNRSPASTFLSLSNVNLSYFVALDANRNCSGVSLLAGDRNITNGGRVSPGHIQARLYPHRDPDKMRRDVVRMLDRELLGISNHSDHEPDPDPAAMI